MQIIEYAKEHPWATGIIVVVGGILFISISGVFKGGGSSASSSGPSDAQVQADATIAAAQIGAQAAAAQAGAALQAAQIGAGVQMHSDDLSAQVMMEQYRVAESLGLKQSDNDTQVSLHTIDAQKDMYITNSNNQVAVNQIIANASKSKNKTNAITGMIGNLAGAAMAIFSDARVKENINLIGRNEDGLGVYAFNYRGSTTGHVGVIAQEVAQHDPSAVTTDAKTGFMKVNMAKINRNFSRLEGGPAYVRFG